MVAIQSSASPQSAHALTLHSFSFDMDGGRVFFQTPEGTVVEHALAEIWRDEELIAKLSPADAFQLGLEWAWQRQKANIRFISQYVT